MYKIVETEEEIKFVLPGNRTVCIPVEAMQQFFAEIAFRGTEELQFWVTNGGGRFEDGTQKLVAVTVKVEQHGREVP